MSTFKDFLKETYNDIDHGDGFTVHDHDLGTHKLQVWFLHDKRTGTASVDFFVGHKKSGNLSTQRGNIPKEKRVAALSKVKRSVVDYIDKHSPRQLNLTGNTDKKNKMYAKFANKIAEKYGAKRQLTPGNAKTIRLNFQKRK